jgi:glycosyltransferase involved in cell wall biosynthesis
LRVLSISTLFPSPARTGFGRFVAKQFDALAERGDVELTVISPIAKPLRGGKPTTDQSRRYPVHYLPFGTIPLIGAGFNPALIRDAALPLIRSLHKTAPFDLIDAQFFFPDGPAAGLIAGEFGLPLSIKARGSDINYWGLRNSPARYMLAAAKHAKSLLAVSEALKAEMARQGLELGKTAVHYTGLDHGLFHPRPRTEARKELAELVQFDDPPLLVSVGNLIPLKRHNLAIEALALLPEARLVIAGIGPEDARLRRLAAKLGVSDRVVMAGSLSPNRIATLLSAANVLVHTSKNEGLANVWLEALACGTPVVATDVGGAQEVVNADTAGRLVEPWPVAVAAGIRELLLNPLSQSEVAANAQKFSWEANAAELSAHYHRIAGR